MLQRGFGKKRGKHHHVWVYEKSTEPKQTSTYKFGAGKEFFSNEGNASADITLTAFENTIQDKIHEWRSLEDSTEVPRHDAGRFVSHLEMRSLFIREEVSNVVQRFIEELEKLFGDQRRHVDLLKRILRTRPDVVERALKEHGLSTQQREQAILFMEVFAQDMIDKQVGGLSKIFEGILLEFKDLLAQSAKKGQLKAISQGFDEPQRTEKHQRLCFIIRRTNRSLVLPDTCLTFFTQTGLTPFTQRGDDVAEVVVPLTTNCYLYGFSKRTVDRQHSALLNALAACSFKAFLAHEDNLDFRRLNCRIGKHARLISRGEIKNIASIDSIVSSL